MDASVAGRHSSTALLDRDAITIGGSTIGECAKPGIGSVVRSLSDPVKAAGGLAILRGSLAPRGAVLKVASADPALLRHRGRAVVFEGVDDVAARIDDPSLDIDASSVLVLRDVGPKGAPGMPEWGMVPIPERLLQAGVRDMVRISDARMSGTAFGTCVLHVAPESYAGGPLGAVRDGDMISLDIDARTIDLEVDPAEIERRLAERPAPVARYTRGYGRLHVDHVLQADEGCDLDFLAGAPEEEHRLPYGLFGGWVGGW